MAIRRGGCTAILGWMLGLVSVPLAIRDNLAHTSFTLKKDASSFS
jgi:hypothetical protein